MRTWRAAVGAFVVAIALANGARADVFGTTFRSSQWGVEMQVPHDWELAEQASYPGVLAYAIQHKTGARMILAAQKLADGETLADYAKRNADSLIKIGYKVAAPALAPSGAWMVEGTATDGKRLRQAYLARGETAYVLTMATPPKAPAMLNRAFDDTLRGLSLSTPLTQPATQPAAAATQPAATTQPTTAAPAASQPAHASASEP